MKLFLLLIPTMFLTAFTVVKDRSSEADAIIGTWQNSTGKGYIQIYRQSGKYFGRINWLKEPIDKGTGQPKLDTKNPDPSKRNAPLMGLVMMHDFVFDDGEWTDGQIYLPTEGKEYSAYIKIKDQNTLSVRGYIGIALFGKTDTWTRVR